jgi:hypothetical protein
MMTLVIKNGNRTPRWSRRWLRNVGLLTAIRTLQEQGIRTRACVVLIEGREESGSFDLPLHRSCKTARFAESRGLPDAERELRPASGTTLTRKSHRQAAGRGID